jgi:hypothetical protein
VFAVGGGATDQPQHLQLGCHGQLAQSQGIASD